MSAYKDKVAEIVAAEQRLQEAREITAKSRAAEERAEKDVSIAYEHLGSFHKERIADAREKAGVDGEKVTGWFA
jgi:hypothetical protein